MHLPSAALLLVLTSACHLHTDKGSASGGGDSTSGVDSPPDDSSPETDSGGCGPSSELEDEDTGDLDLDADGVERPTDCDDHDPLAWPGAVEICGSCADEDCDGEMDESDCLYGGNLTDADTVIPGSAGERLGFDIALNGDLNGDGLTDLVVGAPGVALAGIYLGPVSSGDLSLLNADSTIKGDRDQGTLGNALAYMGDLDGDGYDDLLIGDEYQQVPLEEGGITQGSVYMFYGPVVGTLGPGDADAQYLAPGDGDGTNHFGLNVRNGGDVSGDGVNDIFVSDGYNSVSFFRGGELGVSIEGSSIGASIAWSEDSIGSLIEGSADWTGDGVFDIWLAEAHFPIGSGGLLAACAMYESPIEELFGHEEADAFLIAPEDNSWNGTDASWDINLDGYSDIIVGSPLSTTASIHDGAVYIIYGPITGENLIEDVVDATILGDSARPEGYLGAHTEGLTDMNGDALPEILVNAYHLDYGPRQMGAVYLIPGGIEGTQSVDDVAIWRWLGEDALNRLPCALSTGDTNGDGLSEIAIGAGCFTPGAEPSDLTGSAYLFDGASLF